MFSVEIFGYLAAFCTTISFIPQVTHILKTKDTRAISLAMYSIFTFGIAMWFCYGIMIENVIMTIANAITLTFAIMILCYKIRDVFVAKKQRRVDAD